MNKKIFLPIAIISLLAITFTLTGCSDTGKPAETKNNAQNQATGQVGNKSDTTQTTNKNVKEFSMTSFTDIINGKYFPQYSLKEITVKK